MSGDFPLTPAPSAITPLSFAPTRVSVAHSLKQQVRSGGYQRFGWKVDWKAVKRADMAPIIAFMQAQRGRYDSFNFRPPVIGSRQGAAALAASAAAFGTPDGSTTVFDLLGASGEAVQSVASFDSVHKTLNGTGPRIPLYPTPRTNLLPYSNLNGWASGGVTSPDYYTIQQDSTTGQHRKLYSLSSISINDLVAWQLNLAYVDWQYAGVYIYGPSGTVSAVIDLVAGTVVTSASSGGWSSETFIIDSDGAGDWIVLIGGRSPDASCNLRIAFSNGIAYSPSFAGDGSSQIGIKKLMVVRNMNAITDWIDTAGAPVTVTDYARDGAAITLGQAPATGDALDWSGSYYASACAVASATSSGRAVPIDGATPAALLAYAGTYVRFAGHNKGYRLTADAYTDGLGQATLAIEPALSAAVAAAEDVYLDMVPFVVSTVKPNNPSDTAGDLIETPVVPGILYDYSLELWERP